MGRPRNNVPYQIKGVYHIRFTGDKTATSLNTRSLSEANRNARAVATKRGVTSPEVARESITRPAAPVSTAGQASHGAPTSVFAPSVDGASSGDALSSWLASDSEFTSSPGGEPAPTGSASPGANQGDLWAPPKDSPKAGLTTDERSRMHGLLSGIVGRANVLALGLGVRIFGRIPAEPEPADMELLNKAWQLQLDELLGDKEIKPYVMILAASAGLGIGMYAGGEPLPPKPAKGQPAATGAPLSSVP